jgi:hypothetical protein
MTTTVAAVAAVAVAVVVIWPLKISGFEMRPRRHP